MPKLTKRVVDAIRPDPSGRDVFTWDTGDGAIKGFGIRTKPSGAASYLVQYRTKEARTRRLVLGRIGVLTPDEARALAGDKLKEVTRGGDPSAERHIAREALTVSELAGLYLRDGPADKPNKKASSWGADRSNIERHIKPLLGRHFAKTLTQVDVAKFQADVAAGKSKADIKTKKHGRAIVEGGRGTAARSLAVLGAMLQFAVARKLIPENPAKGVPLYKGEKKERFLSEAEVARWADTIAQMQRDGRLHPSAAAGLRLLVLTGCRKSEIMTLQWGYVDFERSCLRLPDSKTREKIVHLPSAAVELLNALPRVSTWVLPGDRERRVGDNGHYTGMQKAWERVREQAGVPGLRLHDLRHSFASFAVAEGQSLFMVAKLLGHKQTRTTERYAHLAADPILAAADQTANRIAAAMRIGGGNVVVPDFSAKQPQHEDAAATKSGGGRRPASQ
jgi:integrase